MFSFRRLAGSTEEGIPQGLKRHFVSDGESAKAGALAYLEAQTVAACAKTREKARTGTGSMWRRWMSAVVVCLLAVVMLGANPSSRFEKIGHAMICTCGCGQILLECNHVGCPVSPVMIGELHAQVDGGGSDTSIFNWFAAKYGATVLAAPIRGGFDNVAWIAPVAVFLLATLGVGFLIRMWKLRSGQHVAVSAAGPDVRGDALRERIRRETEY